MPDDEGLALHDAGLLRARTSARCSRSGPTAGSRPSTSVPPHGRAAPSCSPSTTTAAPRRTRPGGSSTTSDSSTRGPAAWTRCPFFRRTIEDAGLEDVVVAVIGSSTTVAEQWDDAARAALHRRRPRVRRRARRLRVVEHPRRAGRSARVPRRVRGSRRRWSGAVRGVEARGRAMASHRCRRPDRCGSCARAGATARRRVARLLAAGPTDSSELGLDLGAGLDQLLGRETHRQRPRRGRARRSGPCHRARSPRARPRRSSTSAARRGTARPARGSARRRSSCPSSSRRRRRAGTGPT